MTPAGISSFISMISQLPDGNLCLVGEAMDPDGDLVTQGRIMIVNPAVNRIVWQKTFAPPDDFSNTRFVACRSDGKYVYVGANVDTDSARSLSHTLAYVFKFDDHGKLVAKHNLETGGLNSLVYDIDVDAEGVNVVGVDLGADPSKEKYALYFVKLDSNLKKAQLTRLAKGGFDHLATARLSKEGAYLAGNFHPAVAQKNAAVADYAISRISPAHKYLFSVRPRGAPAGDIATAISPNNDVISLGSTGATTHLTVVNNEGKVVQDLHLKSAYCATESLSADARTVYAVRAGCADQQTKIVAIAWKDGAEKILAGTGGAKIVGQSVMTYPLEGRLLVVSKKSDGSLLLQAIAAP